MEWYGTELNIGYFAWGFWLCHQIWVEMEMKNVGICLQPYGTVWFATEKANEQQNILRKYPGCILLCDRSFTLATRSKEPIKGTSNLHEVWVVEIETEVPIVHPLVWSVKVVNLPCNCRHCNIDPNNTQSIYTATFWHYETDMCQTWGSTNMGDQESCNED